MITISHEGDRIAFLGAQPPGWQVDLEMLFPADAPDAFLRVSSQINGLSLRARETVDLETPAIRAISAMV